MKRQGWAVHRLRRVLPGEILAQVGLVIAWIVLIVVFGLIRPTTFLTLSNVSSILGSNAVLAILAVGLVVVLRSGDFDLSLAATLTFCSVILGVLTVHQHWPLLLAIVAVVVLGAVIGAANAFIVLVVHVDSFITTLGIATLLAGLALWASNNETITGLPDGLTNWVVVRHIGGMPLEFYYVVILMVVTWYGLRYTSVGRRLFLVGKSQDIARLSGIRVARIRFGAFVIAGVFAAVAGIVYAGTSGSVDPTSGISYLLPAFAAVFLGATCIEVGEFNPIGTCIAVYFLVTGVSGLAIIGVPTFVQQVFYGGALIVAVAAVSLAKRAKRSSPDEDGEDRQGDVMVSDEDKAMQSDNTGRVWVPQLNDEGSK